MIKTYSELLTLQSFEERYEYLRTNQDVGVETFGCYRYLNQMLYNSAEWKRFKREIVLRDSACELGLVDYPIFGRSITLHHINPVTKGQVLLRDSIVFDPENVICCSHQVHMMIHYGSLDLDYIRPITRNKNDTCPWRH